MRGAAGREAAEPEALAPEEAATGPAAGEEFGWTETPVASGPA